MAEVQACLIAGAINDLARVIGYSEQVLSTEAENTLAIYNLADALFRQGEVELAKRQAARAYALLCDSSAKGDHDLLELFLKRWPEIKKE